MKPLNERIANVLRTKIFMGDKHNSYDNTVEAIMKEVTMNSNLFEYEYVSTPEEVRKHIQECEGKHTQQAIYSTFHDGLTQVCFGCRKVRSSLKV